MAGRALAARPASIRKGLVQDMSEQRYRVVNKCKYDIGVKLPNNLDVVIKAGSFQLLTADEIVYIESICRDIKFFAKRMLVPCDQSGNEVPMDKLGAFIEEDPVPHKDDQEIEAILKQSVSKIKAWITEIDDPVELHAIADVARHMDLTSAKLKVLQEKMPDAELIS